MKRIITILLCALIFGCDITNLKANNDTFIPVGALDGIWESKNSIIEVNGKYAHMDNIVLLNRHGSSLFFKSKELLIITSFNPNEMIIFNKLTKSTKKYIKINT